MGLSIARRCVVAAAVGGALLLSGATRAGAHENGAAQLFVSSVRVLPADVSTSWDVQVTLIDADSGDPAYGYEVIFEADGPGGVHRAPLSLSDPTNSGIYAGSFDGPRGLWRFEIAARGIAGGPIGLPTSSSLEESLGDDGFAFTASRSTFPVAEAVAGAAITVFATVALALRWLRGGRTHTAETACHGDNT